MRGKNGWLLFLGKYVRDWQGAEVSVADVGGAARRLCRLENRVRRPILC